MAGLYDEAYNDIFWEKISRRGDYFMTTKLGVWKSSVSLVTNFFPEGDLTQLPLVSKKHHQGLLLNLVAVALSNTGHPKEAIKLLSRSNEIEVDLKNWNNVSVQYRNLAEIQFRIGETIQAKFSAKKAVDTAEKTTSDQQISDSGAYLAWVVYLLGKTREAYERFRRSDVIEKKVTGHRLCGLRGVFYADFLLTIKGTEEAYELSMANLMLCQDYNLLTQISQCHRSLGAIERIEGNREEAEIHLQNARKIGRRIGIPFLEIEALLESSRLNLDRRRHKDAIQDANKVLEFCSRTGLKFYEPDAKMVLAKAYVAKKDFEKAETNARSTYEKAITMKYRWAEGDAAHLLGEISLAKDHKGRAREWIEKAVACRTDILDPRGVESEAMLESLD